MPLTASSRICLLLVLLIGLSSSLPSFVSASLIRRTFYSDSQCISVITNSTIYAPAPSNPWNLSTESCLTNNYQPGSSSQFLACYPGQQVTSSFFESSPSCQGSYVSSQISDGSCVPGNGVYMKLECLSSYGTIGTNNIQINAYRDGSCSSLHDSKCIPQNTCLGQWNNNGWVYYQYSASDSNSQFTLTTYSDSGCTQPISGGASTSSYSSCLPTPLVDGDAQYYTVSECSKATFLPGQNSSGTYILSGFTNSTCTNDALAFASSYPLNLCFIDISAEFGSNDAPSATVLSASPVTENIIEITTYTGMDCSSPVASVTNLTIDQSCSTNPFPYVKLVTTPYQYPSFASATNAGVNPFPTAVVSSSSTGAANASSSSGANVVANFTFSSSTSSAANASSGSDVIVVANSTFSSSTSSAANASSSSGANVVANFTFSSSTSTAANASSSSDVIVVANSTFSSSISSAANASSSSGANFVANSTSSPSTSTVDVSSSGSDDGVIGSSTAGSCPSSWASSQSTVQFSSGCSSSNVFSTSTGSVNRGPNPNSGNRLTGASQAVLTFISLASVAVYLF